MSDDAFVVETRDDAFVVVKVQLGPVNDDYMTSMNVQVSTPPPMLYNMQYKQENESGGMSPSVKDPVAFEDTSENKRAKRSAIEKKSRQRRQRGLARMRNEVKQLEHLFTDMVKRKSIGTTGLVQRSNVGVLKGFNGDELQQKYSELTMVAYTLEKDQLALQQLLRELESYHSTVRKRQGEVVFDVWDSGVLPSSSFAAKFRPLSMTEGYSLVRNSYEEIRKFTETENFDTTGASFMGWADKRKYDQKAQAILYSFTKHFPHENAENVFTKSWNAYLDGPKLEHTSFGNAARSRFEVLQVLNDDMLVFRRDYRMSRFPMTFTAVQIMFRLQTPTGYSLCVRTIPSPEIQEAFEPHEYPFDVFHWTHFNRLYNEYDEPAGCEIVMAGSVCDPNQIKSNYWWFEIVCSILRWENSNIAPLFLLQT